MDGPDTAQRSPAYDAGHRWGTALPAQQLTPAQRDARLRQLQRLADADRERAERTAGRVAGYAEAIAAAEAADLAADGRSLGTVLALEAGRRRRADHAAAREAQG